MTEFELAQQQEELDTLKRTQPRWALAAPEPFAHSAQQDVSLPEWNKIDLDNSISNEGSNTSGASFQAIVLTNGILQYAFVQGTLGAIV